LINSKFILVMSFAAMLVSFETSSRADEIKDQSSVTAPMARSEWRKMSGMGKIIYAQIISENLRKSEKYATCLPQDASLIAEAIDQQLEENPDEGPLLMDVAVAVSKFCPI